MRRRERKQLASWEPEVTGEEQRLIDTWFQDAAGSSKETFWAWDELTSLVLDHPDHAWRLLLRMVEQAPDEHIGVLGAGPLETLLVRHGTTFGALAAEQARRDPRFRECLAGVWLERGDVPPAVAERLVELTGGGLKIFSGTTHPPVTGSG